MRNPKESVPFFVAQLRQIDLLRRKKAQCIMSQPLSPDDNADRFAKDRRSQSLQVEDLQDFLHETTAKSKFMQSLPSITSACEVWWGEIARGDTMSCSQLRELYFDIAYALVEGRNKIAQRNMVFEIMRHDTLQWDDAVEILFDAFASILFQFVHLVCPSPRLAHAVDDRDGQCW